MFADWEAEQAPTSTLAEAAGFGTASRTTTSRTAQPAQASPQYAYAQYPQYAAAPGASYAGASYAGAPASGAPGAGVPAAAPAASSKAKKPGIVARLAGLLGELLITAGAFIGLFIVWQVWWTDIIANRAQNEQITAITENWGGTQETDDSPTIGQPRTDEPPAIAHSTQVGNVEGIMRIPAFGTDYKHTIEYGTSLKKVLDTGAFGHYENTAYPGEVGNYALAAHRQTYGAPMKNVEKLKVDDSIIIETSEAYYVYKVKSSYTVLPEAVEVVSPVPNEPGQEPTQRLLTITTCHPPFISDKRWVVHAEFDHWVARSDGIPQELAEN